MTKGVKMFKVDSLLPDPITQPSQTKAQGLGPFSKQVSLVLVSFLFSW